MERPASGDQYVTHFHGADASASIGRDAKQLNIRQDVGDIEQLIAMMRRYGLTDSWLDDLRASVEADAMAAPPPAGALGPATHGWTERLKSASGRGAVTLGSGVSVGLVVAGLKSYLGIG